MLRLSPRRRFLSTVCNTLLVLLLSLGLLAAAPTAAPAQSTDPPDDFQADQLAVSWAPKIVSQCYDYGTNIQVQVQGYKHYESDYWLIQLRITFGGLLDDKVYEAEGRLTIYPDNKAQWVQTRVNANLAAYLLGREVGREIGQSLNRNNP
jgi:hypothetical protein